MLLALRTLHGGWGKSLVNKEESMGFRIRQNLCLEEVGKVAQAWNPSLEETKIGRCLGFTAKSA